MRQSQRDWNMFAVPKCFKFAIKSNSPTDRFSPSAATGRGRNLAENPWHSSLFGCNDLRLQAIDWRRRHLLKFRFQSNKRYWKNIEIGICFRDSKHYHIPKFPHPRLALSTPPHAMRIENMLHWRAPTSFFLPFFRFYFWKVPSFCKFAWCCQIQATLKHEALNIMLLHISFIIWQSYIKMYPAHLQLHLQVHWFQ